MVWNGSHNDLFLRRCQDVFQETSSRSLPGDVLKTSLRRLKTFSRLFLGDILKTSLRRLKTFSRLFLGDVLRTSLRGLKTFWRLFPGDVLKTSLRRLKTFSRLFLVNAKDHLETIYGLSIYVSKYVLKLFTYYHSITRQTNWINLNKLNTLKHGNNAEVMKTWFSMNCQTKKHFFQEFKYFLASEFRIQ